MVLSTFIVTQKCCAFGHVQRVLCGVCAICCALRIRQVCLAKKQIAAKRSETKQRIEAKNKQKQKMNWLMAIGDNRRSRKSDAGHGKGRQIFIRFRFCFVFLFLLLFCVFVVCCYSFLFDFFSALSSSRRSWSCVGGKCEIALAFFSFFLIFLLLRFSWLPLPANALIG